jgi:uncharacterized protein
MARSLSRSARGGHTPPSARLPDPAGRIAAASPRPRAGRIRVRLTPRASGDAIDGWADDPSGERVLLARVGAPPADGRANQALIALLAAALGIAPTRIRIVTGATARWKWLEVEGLKADEIRARL